MCAAYTYEIDFNKKKSVKTLAIGILPESFLFIPWGQFSSEDTSDFRAEAEVGDGIG